ncbi:hypothetical protein [Chengkuizengella marina]|uniref:Beta/gamma crystallin 'Greek key' domain-containing protein n=1 Tax=Chengkuizengella marina TaxID=2507566 RepID=A0A6N9Q8X5_9BACL|nr:hypothetical protein [Chengkuizengella marina]NBI31170.1 hypothetical protein [Chengkuizengella marina]
MLMIKRNTLSSFMIGSLFIILLVTMSVFTATNVNAQEREGYEMVDYGTHKVYFPKPVIQSTTKSSSGTVSTTTGEVSEESKKTLPELNVEGLRSLDDLPRSTYENRTIHKGLRVDNTEYVPVDFLVVEDEYQSDLMLSELNISLSHLDPFVDTFLGVYNPENGMVSNYFPVNPPSVITLLLNSESHFAEGLTLDVEEWWETTNLGASNGSPSTANITREIGINEGQQRSTSITHGVGVGIEWGFTKKSDFLIAGAEWEFKNSISYNYSNNETTSFSRTYNSSITEAFTVDFGTLFPGHPYIWSIYDLVTHTKVNYAEAENFKALGPALRGSRISYGLQPYMSSQNVKIYNKTYQTVELPIFEEDLNLEIKPNNLTVSQDFQNLTLTLNWDAVPADQIADPAAPSLANNGKVAGYYVYKNGVIAALITDPTRNEWIDTKIKPNQNNSYYVRSYTINEMADIINKVVQISLPSNTVIGRVELNAAQLRDMVIGCSIPFAWDDDQLPTGERVYYAIYLGNPDAGGTIMGEFEGDDASINLDPELYDLLKENTNQSYYIVKTVLYDGSPVESEAVSLPNNFTVTDTAFLFDLPDFRGDCVTVSKGSTGSTHLIDVGFDNKVSSMLVQGNVFVRLFHTYSTHDFVEEVQTFFTDENGFAHIRDLNDTIIGSDTVSSVRISDKKEGVYLFEEQDYYGFYSYLSIEDGGMARYSNHYWHTRDNVSSIKVIGDYAYVGYEHDNYTGNIITATEDYGNGNLGSMSNKISGYLLLHGEGVYFFDYTKYRGSKVKRIKPNDVYTCNWTAMWNCGFPEDDLGSVFIIGDYGVTLYEHTDFEGKGQNNRYSVPTIHIGNDKMSSFRIYPKGVYLDEDPIFMASGNHVLAKDPGEYRFITQLGIENDSLSSIFVIGDYRVTLYTDPIFRGHSSVFTDGQYITAFEWNGTHDKISSIKIEEY